MSKAAKGSTANKTILPIKSAKRVSREQLDEIRKAREKAQLLLAESNFEDARMKLLVTKSLQEVGVNVDSNQICLTCGIVYKVDIKSCPVCSRV